MVLITICHLIKMEHRITSWPLSPNEVIVIFQPFYTGVWRFTNLLSRTCDSWTPEGHKGRCIMQTWSLAAKWLFLVAVPGCCSWLHHAFSACLGLWATEVGLMAQEPGAHEPLLLHLGSRPITSIHPRVGPDIAAFIGWKSLKRSCSLSQKDT